MLETSENIKDDKTLFNRSPKSIITTESKLTLPSVCICSSFFNESAMQNLHFPSIDFDNLKKFNKKFVNSFNKQPAEVSILAYDALGLIYYCWSNNNFQFKKEQLYAKKGFKGLHGKFSIENNLSKQNLKIYKISNNKFVKVY